MERRRARHARTRAAFLDDVAWREFWFDLFEILDNQIRVLGDTAIVAGGISQRRARGWQAASSAYPTAKHIATSRAWVAVS